MIWDLIILCDGIWDCIDLEKSFSFLYLKVKDLCID